MIQENGGHVSMERQKSAVIPGYILFLIFLTVVGIPVFRFLQLLLPKLPGMLFFSLWLMPSISFSLGLVLKRGRAKSTFRRLGEGGISLLMYPLMIAVLAEALALILLLLDIKLPIRETGIVCLTVTALALAYGVPHALHPVTVTYRISFDRSIDPMCLVLISDLHMGFFTGRGLLKRTVRTINAQNADAVLIAGDLFDEEYTALRRPERAAAILAGLSSRMGTFACEGNHDRYCPSPEQETFCSDAKITMLRDASVDFNTLQIYGRRDWFDDRRLSPAALLKGDGSDAIRIVLDHNPADFENVLNAGADLVLCGHTHNGQTFPGNVLLRMLPGHRYGLKKYGCGYCIVTSGAGIWGLPIRIGVNTEIVRIELTGRDHPN